MNPSIATERFLGVIPLLAPLAPSVSAAALRFKLWKLNTLDIRMRLGFFLGGSNLRYLPFDIVRTQHCHLGKELTRLMRLSLHIITSPCFVNNFSLHIAFTVSSKGRTGHLIVYHNSFRLFGTNSQQLSRTTPK